mgnify:CR=1 FL=1
MADDGRIHDLNDHLRGTAEKSERFAEEFGASEWGYLAGFWHDLGKFSADFQNYIRAATQADSQEERKPGRVDHSTAGAIQSVSRFGGLGRILAYLIAGHHAGLPDWQSDEAGNGALAQRLGRVELLEKIHSSVIPEDFLTKGLPVCRPKPGTDLALSLWLRMLFSCLVDADFLDTEVFFNPKQTEFRGGYPELTELLPIFDHFMAEKQATSPDSHVNRIRSNILRQCIAKASAPEGFFTLTVPTGGGKTLSSLAFALNHALCHKKRRIIYVIPYTSIIEQTADQFRTIFGEAVVEHHSNLDLTGATEEVTTKLQLACENWDAPIVVTTSVQFFESLFASRTSRCRKLHNIVNSVVILDEAQLLPPDFLAPIIEAMKELQKNYGVTVVFCTATQPALGSYQTMDFNFKGISGMKEIIDDPLHLYRALKRTEVRYLRNLDVLSWQEVADELKCYESVLCIVNRRDDARILWELMPSECIHLSALMCGAHRAKKIAEIKKRLRDGLPTRVISTQIVEAGVDLDFPVVFRAVAGLDSIAQAAGRCNREGLCKTGEVFVFTPPSRIPPGHLRQAAESGMRFLTSAEDDPLTPCNFEAYFRGFYWMRGPRLDAHGILADLSNNADLHINFRSAAKKFHLIDETIQASVIVNFENDELLSLLERKGPDRWLMRRLQRHIVNLPRYLHTKLLAEGAIREIESGIFVQGHRAMYHPDLGFCHDKSMLYEPDELVC